jgi:hypothetical protein
MFHLNDTHAGVVYYAGTIIVDIYWRLFTVDYYQTPPFTSRLQGRWDCIAAVR